MIDDARRIEQPPGVEPPGAGAFNGKCVSVGMAISGWALNRARTRVVPDLPQPRRNVNGG